MTTLKFIVMFTVLHIILYYKQGVYSILYENSTHKRNSFCYYLNK